MNEGLWGRDLKVGCSCSFARLADTGEELQVPSPSGKTKVAVQLKEREEEEERKREMVANKRRKLEVDGNPSGGSGGSGASTPIGMNFEQTSFYVSFFGFFEISSVLC